MKWFQGCPKIDGWYWYKKHPDSKAHNTVHGKTMIYFWYDRDAGPTAFYCSFGGHYLDYDKIDYFAGPIPEPEEIAFSKCIGE